MNTPEKTSTDTGNSISHPTSQAIQSTFTENAIALPGPQSVDRSHVIQARTLIYWSVGLFVLGLMTPCMTMTPHMHTPVGDLMKVWRWFSDSAAPQTFSIVAGVFRLFAILSG